MKTKIITLLLSIMAVGQSMAQMKIDPYTFRDINAVDASVSDHDMGTYNLLSRSMEWPLDADGNENVALIITSNSNVPVSELGNFKVTVSNGFLAAKPAIRELDNGRTVLMVYVPSVKGQDVTYTHPSYGSARLVKQDFSRHHIYTLKVENSKLVNIVVDSDPEGAQITFDGKWIGNTPMTIANVTLGTHEIALTPHNTSIADFMPTRKIDVTEARLRFDYNLRKKTTVTFQADPKGASLIITKDGHVYAQGTGSVSATLPYGEYVIKGDFGTIHTDEPVSVNGSTPATYPIKVIGSKVLSFTATQNNYAVSGAQVNLDGAEVGSTPLSFRVPYGTHRVQMSYYGYITKEKKIKVSETSDAQISLKLPNRHHERHNIFDIDYKKRDWGLAFNYINRHYKFKVGGQSQKYNLWGDEGKNDHGMQIGLSYHPYFGYGQGIITGIYWQYFLGSVDMSGDKANWHDHAIYIPLQYQFRLPFSERFSVFANAGVACAIGVSNTLKFDGDEDSFNIGYGYNDEYETYMPQRVQFSVPIGIGIQIGAFSFEAKYSFGLTDNKEMYTVGDDVDPKTVSYKTYTWQAGVNIVF